MGSSLHCHGHQQWWIWGRQRCHQQWLGCCSLVLTTFTRSSGYGSGCHCQHWGVAGADTSIVVAVGIRFYKTESLLQLDGHEMVHGGHEQHWKSSNQVGALGGCRDVPSVVGNTGTPTEKPKNIRIHQKRSKVHNIPDKLKSEPPELARQ